MGDGATALVHGRLFLFDTLTQRAVNIPLSGKKVTIRFMDSADTLNFLYSATTDAQGYFKFKELRSDKKYVISYDDILEGKRYLARTNVDVSNDEAPLVAELAMQHQSGVLFFVKDANGSPVTGADICVFQSAIPYDQHVCEGSAFSLKSDQYGRQSKFNLANGRYYVLSKTTIQGITYMDKLSFEINDAVLSIPLRLTVPDPAPSTYLDLLITDENGNAVKDVAVCMFTSPDLFAQDTCQGSNYNGITNALGQARITGIQTGQYYVLADLSLVNFRMLGRDTIQIGDGKNEAVIRISKKP